MPGKSVRCGNRVSVWLEVRFDTPPGLSHEFRKSCRIGGRDSRCGTQRTYARRLMNWNGVMSAITTCFDSNLEVDHGFMERHCRWLLDNGCTGIVPLGSLGEGATLSSDEKVKIVRTCVRAASGRAPVVASISALSTSEAVSLAKAVANEGADALMVLPPYVYQGDWREMKAHVAAVFQATPLACMLYNNPIAYGTDFLPEQITELAAEHSNFQIGRA